MPTNVVNIMGFIVYNNKSFLLCMNDMTAIGPSDHVGATYCCLFVKPVLQPDPLLECTDDPPPSPTQLLR